MKVREYAALAVLAAVSVALWLAPGPRPTVQGRTPATVGEVVETDDSLVAVHGLVRFGTQRLKVRLDDGRVFPAENELRAQRELDKTFSVGDAVVVGEPKSDGDTLIARDHWRLGRAMWLFGAFAGLLWLFGGTVGLRALFTFVFCCLAVWKLLVPLTLSGWPASATAFATVLVLTAVIMYFVAGPTRQGVVAFAGSMLGVGASLALAHFAAVWLKVDGATLPFVQQLLYSGHSGLDIQDIFAGTMVLSASGALMDLSMDIAAGVREVKLHNRTLGFGELLRSGLRIGRAVTGTMTTTLLLAYSGGYLTLLMVFAAEGVRPADFVNSTLVSAELVKTLVGSFGLVLVAPFTAVVAAWLYGRPAAAPDD